MEQGKTALLIIDLQEDFLPKDGNLAVPNGREVINPIIELMNNYEWDTIVATKDWHPSTSISFALVHGLTPFTEVKLKNPVDKSQEMVQTLWPVHCVQDTKGSEFPEIFAKSFQSFIKSQDPPTKVVLKGYLEDREYYSCFQDVWGLHKTECAEYLHENNIRNVVVVGLAYDYCVLNSSIDSVKNGFTTFVVKELSRSVCPEKDVETTKIYEHNDVKIISLENLTKLLQRKNV